LVENWRHKRTIQLIKNKYRVQCTDVAEMNKRLKRCKGEENVDWKEEGKVESEV
jgi:hypothetical protein